MVRVPLPDLFVNWKEWVTSFASANASEAAAVVRLSPFKIAQLPPPGPNKYGMVFCTDTSPAQPVFSSGTAWIRVTDGVAV